MKYAFSAAGFVILLLALKIGTAPQLMAQVKAALTRDVDHPAMNPFAKVLCIAPAACNANDVAGPLPSSFVVPATTKSGAPVKRLVVSFVSGNCVGTGRATEVFVIARPPGGGVTADTGDSFTDNHFPLSFAQWMPGGGINAVAAFASPTQIMWDPGTTVRITYDTVVGGQIYCRAQLNGYFVTQ